MNFWEMNNNQRQKKSYSFANLCWDAWCCLSLVGIWPRFIEPKLISTSHLALKIDHLPNDLKGLKILQFSDLHLHPKVSQSFLNKASDKILALKPDIILFTGDFLCFALPEDLERLETFFKNLYAPHGCYAILGNHDYSEFVSINSETGEYDTLSSSVGSLMRILKRLWTTTKLAFKTTQRAKAVIPNENLEKLLKNTPFRLLKNETIQIPIKNSFLNLSGLEEYVTGRCDPIKTLEKFNPNYPGITMIHNPDALPYLLNFPADLFLAGHTHGGQVNLPWLWKKFTLMENPELKKGLVRFRDRWIYINRGIGSVIPFRWFAVPEILLITLESVDES